MRRRVLLLAMAAAAVLLVPWSAYLAGTLPDRFVTRQWRAAWVGFDVALVALLAGGLWLGLRRRRAAVPVLAASAALLFCDAWFDVSLDWGSGDEAQSLLLALLLEAPFGILLLAWGRRLISGDVRPERLVRRRLPLRAASWHDRLRAERQLLAWVAKHRAEFGAWGYGQRVVAHLSTAEMARFAAEYRELVSRYRLLHPAPSPATREVGIRCYAFPMRAADDRAPTRTPDGRS